MPRLGGLPNKYRSGTKRGAATAEKRSAFGKELGGLPLGKKGKPGNPGL